MLAYATSSPFHSPHRAAAVNVMTKTSGSGEVGIVGQRLVVRIDEERGDRGGDRHDRPHRKVDAPGGDHERHADREQHDRRSAPEDVDDVAEQVTVDDRE